MKFNRAILLFLAFPVLAGCARISPVPVAHPEAERLFYERIQAAARVTGWDLRGRLAVTGPEGSGQARIVWTRTAVSQRIDLSGPLNQGTVRIEADPAGARARHANGKIRTAPDAEALLALETGWQLPVNSLYFWLLGVPVPDTAHVHTLDETGRATLLVQAGWRVRYEDYARNGISDFPSRVFLSWPDAPDPQEPAITARLVIDRLTVNTAQ